MDKETKEIWDKLRARFPESAYKDVTLGRTFTSIDAYHIIERLTDVFGLMGQGWTLENIKFETQGSSVACIGELVVPKLKLRVPAVGDGVILKINIAEAMKKAQTNLISKASSFIGVGLDVYQGKHDSDPLLDRAQFIEPEGGSQPPRKGKSSGDFF